MTHAFDVLVLGDVNPDLILSGGDVVPAFGQAERLVDDARLTLGGSGSIFAAGAARLGLRVAIAGVVGDDVYGRYARDVMDERGVDTRALAVDPEVSTGLSVILSRREDRAILTHLGTIASLGVAGVDPAVLTVTRHVHVTSFFLQRRLAPDVAELFAAVRARGGTTSLDPNWDPSGGWDGGLSEALAQTDVFLPNGVEASRVAGTDDLDRALDLLTGRAGVVVVKDGERGAVVATRSERHRVAPLPVQAVDTTGAGDSFDAGFLAGWLGGRPLVDAVRLANACGALSTRALGGTPAQATLEEADAFLAKEVAPA